MGLLTSSAICSAGFLIGTLFTCLIWDSTILWPKGPITEEVIIALENYYLTWWSAPTAVKVFLHLVLVGLFLSMVAKFARYTESAYYFTGFSLLLMVLTTSLYIVVTLPSLRAISLDPLDKNALVAPGVDVYTRIQSYWSREKASINDILAFQPMDWEERTTMLSVMSAANTIALVLLAGVVLLQVSEWYVEESIAAEIEADRKKAQAGAPVTEEKKKQ